MAQIDYPPVQQALTQIKQLSADEETRRLAFVRERALRDERTDIRAALEQGKIEGEAAILEKLLIKRFGPFGDETSARLKSATAEQLERWAERILDASSLDEVFAEN